MNSRLDGVSILLFFVIVVGLALIFKEQLLDLANNLLGCVTK